MTKHGHKTSSEHQRWLRWSLGTMLMGILALNAGQAHAQSLNLDIERAGHPMTVSTETHGVYLKYGVKATGDTSVFCAKTNNVGDCQGSGLTASDDAHTVVYAVELEWTKPLGAITGLPVRTVGGLNGFNATTRPVTIGATWRWDDRIEGPISATETRPLLATMRLVSVGTEYNVGSNNTLKFAVNPQISIENDEATEGTDTHLIFKVTLLPPALETTTADYGTQGASATGGGVDFTDTNGTLTWTAGQSIKYVRVPIIDDSVSDGGEEMLLQVTNASGVTRFVDSNGNFQAAGLGGIGTINNDEPSDDLVGDLPLVSIEADAESETEGSRASFTLRRTGEATDTLTVSLTVAEDGAMLAGTTPTSASFDAGSATATIEVDTVGDDTDEADSKITVTLATGDGYKLGTNNQSEATTTILDDDAATLPGGTVAVAGTTVWTADMTVTDYGNGSIGAGTAALLANQRGSEGLQARNLYYHTGERKLRMAFTNGVDTTLLTLAAGSVKLKFPESRSGDSSFTWENVTIDWTDEQTFEARLVRGEQEAVDAPDPTLKTLTVSDATLSPAFDGDTVAYTATVAAATERVTLAGTLSDDDASLAYTPSTDADSSTDGHQIDVAVGDTTATVTVTAADGQTTRAYRVVVKRPAAAVVETSTPTVSIAGASGTEGADSSISFTVTLDEAADDAVTVDYATADGTATAGSDYTSTSGTLTFNAGTTSQTISVSIADDETDESDETFTLTLSNASGANLGTSTATGTITNRAVVVETTPALSIADGSGKEGDDSSITFTVTLDEAASGSVTVDYATSDATADAGDDYTTTSGTLTFNAGTTSKTISVSIDDDVENESDETFTVTLSNASGADLGTSTATGTIQNRRVEPLTTSFSGMPTEHDGSSFTFELHFSENPEMSFRTLRDHAFTVDEGDVTRAQRKNPQTTDKNKTWTITVEPDGNDTISITLPATTSCSSNRGICTGDERKLSHSTSATVEGPVGISVDDVEVEEGAGVVLAFQVALTRAASSALTVDYATSDGTATAGADYTSTSGTLTIGAGSSSGTIEVPIIDDEHNEGSETFTLTLSNASSGTLTDATATGTITNHDALPAALVARFGRTAAVHVVDQVEERVNAPRAPGFDGRVAGRQVNRDMGQDFALDFLQQLGSGYGAGPAGVASPGGMRSSLGPQGAVTSPGPMAQSGGLQRPMPMGGGLQHDAGFGLSMGGRDQVLQGSGFALNRATSSGGVLSFWSRSAQSSFYGQDGALALNGDVRSTMFGADYSKGRMITGVSLSHSRGLGSYAGVDTGRMTSAVTGLYPWVGFRASERVTVWTVAGYGAGGLLLSPGAGAPVQTGLSMALAAGGGRGELLAGDNGFELAFKADALWVGTRTDAASGPSGNLEATRAGITRLRTALEGSQSMTVGGRMAFTPSVEVGIRQDGGDAEVGRGLDVGLGLVVADGVTGLAVDVRIRRLLVHQAADFSESGMAVSVSYDPSPKTPLGFTARVAPAWGGDAMSGPEELWGRETMSGMGQYGMPIGGSRLDTEVGYGLPLGARFVGTPRVGMRRSEYGRDYRVGYGVQVLEQGRLNLELGIDAERRESPVFHLQEGSAGTDQRVLGRATVQW